MVTASLPEFYNKDNWPEQFKQIEHLLTRKQYCKAYPLKPSQVTDGVRNQPITGTEKSEQQVSNTNRDKVETKDKENEKWCKLRASLTDIMMQEKRLPGLLHHQPPKGTAFKTNKQTK